jgi:hypothetical protein
MGHRQRDETKDKTKDDEDEGLVHGRTPFAGETLPEHQST